MAYLAAVSSSTMPIFILSKGDVPPLGFPTVGSLHTIQLFTNKLQASLLSCTTSGAKVVWKQYHDSISLILVTSDTTANDIHSNHMLDLIFNAMVLLVGLQELENLSSVERLKKDLKCGYPLIDYIFKGGHTMMSPITQAVDVIALESTSLLLVVMQGMKRGGVSGGCFPGHFHVTDTKTLEAFTEAAKSRFGCLSIHGRICAASKEWWDLSSLETSLLSLFLCCLPRASSLDIPIYLPVASNRTAHRLVIFTILEGVHLSILCTGEPPLSVLQEKLALYWSPLTAQLRKSVHTFPRGVHLGISFDPSILAFCLVNSETKRSLTSLKPTSSGDYQRTALTAGYQGEIKLEKRYSYLLRFYKTVFDDILPSSNSTDQIKDMSWTTQPASLSNRIPHKVLETYSCLKNHKAYAITKENYNLFILFNPSTPTFTLKKLSSTLFENLVHDKTLTII